MYKKLISLLSILMLAGCASDTKQQQLTDKLNQMDAEIKLLKSELNSVKGKPIVQLPSGSPTVMEARKQTQTEEDFAYQNAMGFYKSGDINVGIKALEKFNTDYPNSKYQRDVLYYLAQSSYTNRDIARAQQVLEELIYQNQKEVVNPNAFDLLKKIYSEQGEKDKLNSLNSYIQN